MIITTGKIRNAENAENAAGINFGAGGIPAHWKPMNPEDVPASTRLLRVRDWRTKLLAWALTCSRLPFAWGETDCGTLARTALGILFGRDVVPDIRPWRSARGAALAWRRHPPDRVFQELGAEVMPLAFARSGDVIVCAELGEAAGGHVLVVCVDGTIGLTSGDTGVMLIAVGDLPAEARAYSLWEIADRG